MGSRRGVCGYPPEHDADHGETNECSDGCSVAFEVSSQTTVATDPREGSFDDPTFWQHLAAGNNHRFGPFGQF